MRRTYISPEFNYIPVSGTLNMLEQSSFFGSKMLEISESIQIKNDNIIYYQQLNGQQINQAVELSLPQVVYDTVQDKQINHTIKLDEAQTEAQKNGNARWIIEINLRNVLRNYIFANLKKFRTFEGVLNSIVTEKNIDSSIYRYIDNNIISRYKFTKVEFFYKSIDLLTTNNLKYSNKFDINIEIFPNSLYTKFQTETDVDYKNVRVIFSQDKPASQYSFNYYFNLYFEKL
jgi:hypothetical protein